jgi:hypothetical protein
MRVYLYSCLSVLFEQHYNIIYGLSVSTMIFHIIS